LGAVFDTVNLRRTPLPVETAAEDANDAVNPFGVNAFSGFNVNTIAIEVPAKRLTGDGAAPSAANGTIGVYASTSRQQVTIRRGSPALNPKKPPAELLQGAKSFRQVSRMGNPLVNELIIAVGKKDLWNATDPSDEAQFLDSYRNLAVADALKLVSGVDVPAKPRNDVVHLLTQYADQDPTKAPFAELLRLDRTVAPTPPASEQRLGRQQDRPDAYVELATAFMKKSRESGDPGYYARAAAALDRALAVDPNDYPALRVRPWVLLGQHDFRGALAAAECAHELEP